MKKILFSPLSFVLLLTLILFIWSTYNGLVYQEQTIRTQWSQVENQYLKRFNLIPKLVSLSISRLPSETNLISELSNTRQEYRQACSLEDRINSTSKTEQALLKLLQKIENSPIKEDPVIKDLLEELDSVESNIQLERMRYNCQAFTYNTKIKLFPAKFIAKSFGFHKEPYFLPDPEFDLNPIHKVKDVEKKDQEMENPSGS